MADLSQLPPLHPKRILSALEIVNNSAGTWETSRYNLAIETARAALEVVQKLQTGFGFAPDLYDKVEMAKTTVAQGRTILELLKGLTGKK